MNKMEKRTYRHPILYFFLYLFSLEIFTTKMAKAQIIPIKVGVVLDMDDYAEMSLTCISMALSDFYSTNGYYKTRLALTNRVSKGDVVGAADAAVDLLKNVEVQAIICPTYSGQASFLISLGNKSQVPIITFTATSASLTSTRSPYFVRATLSDSSQVDAIAALVKTFGWQEVVPIYVDNEFGEGIMPFLIDALEQFLSSKMVEAQNIPIKVGVVLEMDDYGYGEMALTCISMALDDFYSTHDHYKTRLVLTTRNPKGDVVGAAAAAVDLLKNVQVQAIIGPMFSGQDSFLISLGNKSQVPIITFSATSPPLTSTAWSPYFIRATLNDSTQVGAIGALVKTFGWREVVPIYVDNEFGEGIIPYLTDALEQVNARISYKSEIPPLATDDQIVAELHKLITMTTRVFIVHMLSPLASRLFNIAKQEGMMTRDYAWIITDGITNELSSMDPSAIESMLGVIGVKPYVPKTNELDDFRIRYKRRNNPRGNAQDLDIFGLWAYDAAMALAIAAENANLGNPKYQEANVSRDSTDIEGIGISDAGPKLIQALSRTTFKGLAGNFNLVDGQLQSPPYEIVNMVGPGARCIGYWTKENGIVKDLNFTSTNTATYSTSKSNLRLTIWPGDVSSSPRGWVIPTDVKTLRVGVPVRNGFTEFVGVTWNSNSTTKVEGFCIDIFDAVMSALPYGVAYEYIPFATKDMAGNYNDLIYQVYLGNYDAVAGDVTIVANRSKYVDFTIPYTESGIAMIVPVKETRKNSWLVVEQLWFTIFCSFLFIVILERILQQQITKYFRQPFWYELGMILWFAFAIIVFTHRKKVVKNLARLVLILWFLVVLILTQSYTASLSSKLTVQNLNPKVTDIDMLIKNKEYVGYMTGSFVFGLLKQMNIDESRLVKYDSPEELHKLFSKGSNKGGIGAAFQEISYTKMFLNKYCSQYTRVDPIYNANGFAFVLPIGSPLVSDVSRAILSVTESQQMVEIERKWFGDKNKCVDPVTEINLEVRSFWGLFAFVGGAGLMSLAICITLFLCHEEDRNRNLLPPFLNTILLFFLITRYPTQRPTNPGDQNPQLINPGDQNPLPINPGV